MSKASSIFYPDDIILSEALFLVLEALKKYNWKLPRKETVIIRDFVVDFTQGSSVIYNAKDYFK